GLLLLGERGRRAGQDGGDPHDRQGQTDSSASATGHKWSIPNDAKFTQYG
ncbi:MAG: hypothetical protein QOJ12_444, partial [Thermoleophilales bacterium]|nr:hypothetical protein [Thermoleophilales bacterium]